MISNKKIIMKYIRKDLMLAFALEILIILCLAISLYGISKTEHDKSLLINVLGKQRMLTQSITKDINTKYSLMQAEKLDHIIEAEEVIQEKYDKIKGNIIEDTNEFDKTLNQIIAKKIEVDGKIISVGSYNKNIDLDLEKTFEIWSKFQESVNTVVGKNEVDNEFIQAVIFISDSNEVLLDHSDRITNAIVNDKIERSKYYKNLSIFTAIAFLMTMGVSLYRLYKYLILPLGTFIEGMNDIGILKKGTSLVKATQKEVVPIVAEITGMSQKMERLISLIETVNQNLSITEELQFIFDNFSFFIPYSYIGVALVKDEGKTLEASYGISDGSVKGLAENLLGKRFDANATSLKSILDTGKPRIINDLESYNKSKTINEYNKIVMDAGVKASITLPLIANNKPIGVIFFSSIEKNKYNIEHLKFLEVITQSLAISFDRNLFVDNLLYSSILALAKLAEARDEDTGEHLYRMKVYSKNIAQFLYEDSLYKEDITPDYIDDIERFSPMHDIGKVGIRDGILLKPGKLTFEEFEEMKQHTLFGGKVLRAAEENILQSGRSIFAIGIEIAEGHHEKWDGSGYPNGKIGEDIPLSARIVALADVFDALTSKRPYKKAFSFEASFEYITKESGKHFDPEIIRVLTSNKERIWKLYEEFHGENSILRDDVKVV